MRLRPVALPIAALLSLAGCVTSLPGASSMPVVPADPAVAMLAAVAARVEPVAEQACRAEGVAWNCNFTIALADDPELPANAFQTVDSFGRPLIVVTMGLLNLARNADEMAFVLGHEAAHHVVGHIPRRREQAIGGAVVAGAIARASGLSEADVAAAQGMGAEIAARQYSREFELEADALGAWIAWAAGYDPVHGAGIFRRLPDPGTEGAASHPSMAQRLATVRAAVAEAEASAPRPPF
ncbi:MAG: M48 family metallopeptidase [Rhodobacteraceae bacterium]|jgi:predicted Zn-dependent protease|nr:M48 family metallopeptidase [Paracoccaceae bacterium]